MNKLRVIKKTPEFLEEEAIWKKSKGSILKFLVYYMIHGFNSSDWCPQYLKLPIAVFCFSVVAMQIFGTIVTMGEIGVYRSIFLLILIPLNTWIGFTMLRDYRSNE